MKEFGSAESHKETEYSPEFKQLVEGGKLREVLRGSHVDAPTLEKWEEGRRFIAEGIHKDGTILDYGCANGFLLRSLEEWTDYEIDPYGIDTDAKGVAAAREMFPEKADHFVTLEETGSARENFPKSFDFIYWNAWDNYQFESEKNIELLRQLESRVDPDGRLLLGLYDTKEHNAEKIKKLAELGYVADEILQNPTGNETMLVFEKREKKAE